MSDSQKPDDGTAPNGSAPQTPPSEPATPPADGNQPPNPAPTGQPSVSLTEDQKTYLKGQGLTDADLSGPEALSKIINHAQTSQKEITKMKAESNKGAPTPPQVPDPTNQPGGNGNGQPSQPSQTPAPAQSAKGIDRVTAFNIASNLASQFKLLQPELQSGKFYEDMAAAGIPATTPAGEVNLDGMINFAKFAQGQKELAAKLEEANKPPEGAQPNAEPSAPQQPASDAPMTSQMAKAILLQDPNHARAAEAKQFIQDEARKI